MVSNVIFNGKKIGQNKNSGCCIVASLKHLSSFPSPLSNWGTSLWSMALELSHWVSHTKPIFQDVLLSVWRLQPKRRLRNQNNSLFWDRWHNPSAVGHCARLWKYPSIAAIFVLILWALQQGWQVGEGGWKMQKTPVKDAQLKSPFVAQEVVPPHGFLRLFFFFLFHLLQI